MNGWLVVNRWDEFQHSDVTRTGNGPVWIRNYTRLLSDDAYLELSGHQRGVLHGLWLEYARARGQLRLDTRSLSRRIGLRVTSDTLIALSNAGFIDFLHADVVQPARLEEIRREEISALPLEVLNRSVENRL